jgi:aminopeptidase N
MPINKPSLKGYLTLVVLAGFFLSSCKTQKESKSKSKMDEAIEASIDSVVNLPEIDFADLLAMSQEPEIYNASATRLNDILHTSLEVSFDIPAQQLFGKASILVKPYFYPVDSLILDAKAFDIKQVALKNKKGELKNLNYTYRDYMLRIALDTTYTRSQQYEVFIDYVANPEKVVAEGSAAITDAKGLYFIDPKDKDPEKPTQIWTQGETESSSCWFPTIDKPNEKMTHDIKITVPEKYKTLSNGLKTKSIKNADGTRTDTWEMKMQNAPYLVMMAIGEFSVVKDSWNKIDVDYYVEPEFELYARNIFGNTPEMLKFFSEITGVTYPWPKYSQVAVRDYVSGAMENTSATLFGEFVQQTPEEMIDQDYEDVIAHELFHHWFGDMVTCESWANLPLNESFATYGEYLWNEHKYGRDAADLHLQNDLSTYIEESFQKKVDLIRFNYEKREDMFDRHSYQKGGCVLHMLRKTVGDEAFFESLKIYLTDNAYQAAEIHHLRLAFEKVTGEDLNWFFNQWFLDKGHPLVEVKWNWSEADSTITLELTQTQNLESTPVYRLPLEIALGFGSSIRKEKITFEEQNQSFAFKSDKKPDFLLVDSEHQLLGQITQQLTVDEARELYLHGELYRDRFEAVDILLDNASEPGVSEVLKLTLKDKFWKIRSYVLERLDDQIAEDTEGYKPILIQLAKNDPKSTVRSQAIGKLGFAASEPEVFALFETAMKDSSSMVKSSALASIYGADANRAIKLIEPMEKTAKGDMLTSIAAIYADAAVPGKLEFLKSAFAGISDPNDRYIFVQLIGRYVISQEEPSISESISYFEDVSTKSSAWFIRLSGIQVLAELQTWYDSRVDAVNSEIQEMKEKGTALSIVQDKEVEKTIYKKKSSEISVIIDTIRETEKDPNLTRILNMFR